MRFKMRSRVIILFLVMMMTSQICHPSLANESRDLIDDHAVDEVRYRVFPPSPNKHNANQRRLGAARAGSARAGPSQARPSGSSLPQAGPSGAWPPQAAPRLSRPPQYEPRLARPIQPGYRDDLPEPSEDFPMVDPPPLYSINGRQRPPPPYASANEGQPPHPLNPGDDILPPPPAYDQIFPKGPPRPQRRQSLSSSGRTRLASNQAGGTIIEIASMEARAIFTVILPQIQRERPTLQEMRLKGPVRRTDANNFEFEFKASDIVREGGRRKNVICGVRATRSGLGLRDFRASGLTCELSRRNMRGWVRSERYYPVRNRNFEEEFQPNGLEQVRNRIFPVQNQNWIRPPAGPSGAGPSQAGPPQTGAREDRLAEHFGHLSMEDPPPLYSADGPPPPYASANLGQSAHPLSGGDDNLPPPPAYDRVQFPRRLFYASQTVPPLNGQRSQRRERPVPVPVPRPDSPPPFDAQSGNAREIFALIISKIHRERPTLLEIRLKKARKLEGLGNYKFGFKASDIVRDGGQRKPVRCSVKANIVTGRYNMISQRDLGISGLTCKRSSGMNVQRLGRYYPVRNRDFEEKSPPNGLEKVRNRILPTFP